MIEQFHLDLLDLYLYCPPNPFKFIGRFEEHLSTGRGMFFYSFKYLAEIELIHGCHESVERIQLKSTINFKLHFNMTYYSCFDKEGEIIARCQTREDIEVLKKMGRPIVEVKEMKNEESVVCSLTGSPSDYNEDY